MNNTIVTPGSSHIAENVAVTTGIAGFAALAFLVGQWCRGVVAAKTQPKQKKQGQSVHKQQSVQEQHSVHELEQPLNNAKDSQDELKDGSPHEVGSDKSLETAGSTIDDATIDDPTIDAATHHEETVVVSHGHEPRQSSQTHMLEPLGGTLRASRFPQLTPEARLRVLPRHRQNLVNQRSHSLPRLVTVRPFLPNTPPLDSTYHEDLRNALARVPRAYQTSPRQIAVYANLRWLPPAGQEAATPREQYLEHNWASPNVMYESPTQKLPMSDRDSQTLRAEAGFAPNEKLTTEKIQQYYNSKCKEIFQNSPDCRRDLTKLGETQKKLMLLLRVQDRKA